MHRVLVVLLAVACTDPLVTAADAGSIDGGVDECRTGSFLGPPCCDEAGRRVAGAVCTAGAWSCDLGERCECEGEQASFVCADFCGSDAFVDARCGAEGWTCDGLVRTSDCPSDTCWGMPGDCCVNPTCVEGAWRCESIRDPCE